MDRGVTRAPGALHGETALTLACALLGVLPVWSLLAWSYGLGPFAAWAWGVGAPSVVALVGIATALTRTGRMPRLLAALVAGVVGGVIGTIAYDAVRVPQQIFGLRPFIPIQSYGLLLLGAHTSSPLTATAGWAFNFVNGIGFGITYAVIALGRRWYWAVAWAMALETSTVISPFAQMYQLSGKWGLIAMAYAAHVAYGYPLGRIVEAGTAFSQGLRSVVPQPVLAAFLATAVGLVLWHRPWTDPAINAAGRAINPGGAGAVISGGRFYPEWLRVAPGECARVRNVDGISHTLSGADGVRVLAPGGAGAVCSKTPGVARVRADGLPYSGGILFVDPAMRS